MFCKRSMGLFCLLLLPFLLPSCSSEDESDYFFSITNAMDLEHSDGMAIMHYVGECVDMHSFTLQATSNEEAESLAMDVFGQRISTIDDTAFNAMFVEDDFYSLILLNITSSSSPGEAVEVARKTWPTTRNEAQE